MCPLLSRNAPYDDGWRAEGAKVLGLLVAFTHRVQGLEETLLQPLDQLRVDDVHSAMQAVNASHDELHVALAAWANDRPPGFGTASQNDSSRGGFAALNLALHEGFRATCLAHLTLLGLSIHGEQVARDGLTDEVEEAHEIAVTWYEEAIAFAKSIAYDPKPRTTRINQVMTTVYADRVPESAPAVFGDLQPYLDQLNRLPAVAGD